MGWGGLDKLDPLSGLDPLMGFDPLMGLDPLGALDPVDEPGQRVQNATACLAQAA